jgi:UDP-N-acetylglucosamine acyltransferase
VHLDDWVFLGGLSGVHQFVRVGAHAMTGFQTRLAQDLPPFVTAAGNPAQAQGVNQEGLRRRGYTPERIARVRQMPIERLSADDPGDDGDVALMQAFLASAERGIVR